MRIVIDLQGAQSESRFRGIGRYSLSFTKALIRNRGEHEILIALSGLFQDTIEIIRAELDALLPQENIYVWDAPGPVFESASRNSCRREVAELIRESFLHSLRPDIVHITSLFEGYEDDAITSIGAFDKTTPVCVSLYDLIPLLNPDHYLKSNPSYNQYYKRKLSHLRHASLLLSISEHAKQEAIEHLNQITANIINISTAADPCFIPLTEKQLEAYDLNNKFGISRQFILYTGGADERKNLPRLIRAYAQLSKEIRSTHQLVFAGKLSKFDISQLQNIANSSGIDSDELIFAGYVTDADLLALYNLCKIYVFPSWHEGFGLPALEAMSCGAAVIGANTSSLPEVISNEDALFNPFSEDSIKEKLEQLLTNESFLLDLKNRSLEISKRFTWDDTACKAIIAFEKIHKENKIAWLKEILPPRRLKLAYISPLPPERSGISDYSADLLPALSKYYYIDVIVAQSETTDQWINDNCQIRDIEWFRANANNYERIIYQFGNSPFHQHMFKLLDEIPGVVVLHDFYLSGVIAYMDIHGITPNIWSDALYKSHGYNAVRERLHAKDLSDVILKYPCNHAALEKSLATITHSKYSKHLAKQWFPSTELDNWAIIPLLRTPALQIDRSEARQTLGLDADDFVTCSFGLLDPIKLNHRLLEAWLLSDLAKDKNSILVFVGENHGGEFGQKLVATIKRSGLEKRIRISGWVDTKTFHQYLAAADLSVQLRTHSRGETSAAVLDCMNYGLPTIVNANGSMAELPDEAVLKLPDEFSNTQLIDSLEKLWKNTYYREQLGNNAGYFIHKHHAPSSCANQYFDAIEHCYRQEEYNAQSLLESIATHSDFNPNDKECILLAQAIAHNHPLKQPMRRIFLDISATYRNDLKTGIERVARALLLVLIKSPPQGYRIEPVYLTVSDGQWHYRFARDFTLNLLDCPTNIVADESIDAMSGDIIIGLDYFAQGLVDAEAYLDQLYRDGIKMYFFVYDLLPILIPHAFPPGADRTHANWLRTITKYDGAICISKTVANDLTAWIKHHGAVKPLGFEIKWSHLGADIENSVPTIGIPNDANKVMIALKERTSFLMVGTIEPRKGYAQTVDAFELLWAEGLDVNLVIVGNEGWRGLPDKLRRTIPATVSKLRSHCEMNKRIFWLKGISDEYLDELYANSNCLITASEGEGFGLPLIEAAQHNLPIIARDIPIFREVAGEHAFYFDGSNPAVLAASIRDWLKLYKSNRHPRSDSMPWLTWSQSARNLLNALEMNTFKDNLLQ